ncbi:ActS/PrrB/RegB family redox-sensitive histidine kinase [Fretibacter rubidus]|uniref:ActS/PrrB/RegB family redox-sensitive histidine kinase n=1 Tax=Fretibacter rubidus TaxID=570162 RepID=UPI00352B9BC0
MSIDSPVNYSQSDAASYHGVTPPDTNAAGKKRRRKQPHSGQLRRSTLITLRWIAIAGQALALVVVSEALGFSYPYLACSILVGLSAVLNLAVTAALPLDRRVGDVEAVAQLGFDVLQLSALLWLTGGMTNPFALLFVAPVVTSATTLSRRVIWIIFALAAGASFFLLHYSYPLPWMPPGGFTLPFQFTLGLWVALLVGMVFTSGYAWQASREARRMSDALTALETVLAHEQKLAALGGLAAAAAHELGTPLATIQLTANEMARELPSDSHLGEDARLLVSQTQRCREILKQLSSRGDAGDAMHDVLSLESLLEEASDPYFGLGSQIDIKTHGDGPAPDIRRQAEILFGLKNYIENAVEFAESTVQLIGQWSPDYITIQIIDDGPGFDPAVRGRLGEPYVSGRGEREEAGGLGLGFFIAKTLIERTGGRVGFDNKPKASGAVVTITWPRAAIAD